MASLKMRGGVWYVQVCEGGQVRRHSLRTSSIQIAKERLRQIESAKLRGADCPLPTRTPIADIVAAYMDHIRLHKTASSVKTDAYYLRQAFGPCCPALAPPLAGKTWRPKPIPVAYLEEMTTEAVSVFIGNRVREGGLAPKTANRYREVLHRLVAWAMRERGVKMPGDKNPVAHVGRYRVRAPEITYLTLEQIDRQLAALADEPMLQAMVAVYIYAGLRREEALWLRIGDIDLRVPPHGVIRIQAKSVDGDRWEPKTKRNRIVGIGPSLRAYLDRYTPRITPGKWYFTSPEGKRWDPDNFSAALRDANRKANISWSCAIYRHTFASQLAIDGVSLQKIAALMGNSPEICRRHYAALSPESLIECVEFGANRRAIGHE